MKLKCKLGVPQHGWLPILLTYGDFRLEMDVSDVPVNSVDLLVHSLSRVIDGLESDVWWHLEPASYTFSFSPKEMDKFSFGVSFLDGSVGDEKSQHIFECTGSRDEIILPFWRAVMEFASHSYTEPEWPAIDELALTRLTTKIRND